MGNVLSKYEMDEKMRYHLEKKRKSREDDFRMDNSVRGFRMQEEFGPKKFIKP
tara:strand:+ start:178 stop:336 length:159 start_codon:yes stop_codon:yes gene_type:complete